MPFYRLIIAYFGDIVKSEYLFECQTSKVLGLGIFLFQKVFKKVCILPFFTILTELYELCKNIADRAEKHGGRQERPKSHNSHLLIFAFISDHSIAVI